MPFIAQTADNVRSESPSIPNQRDLGLHEQQHESTKIIRERETMTNMDPHLRERPGNVRGIETEQNRRGYPVTSTTQDDDFKKAKSSVNQSNSDANHVAEGNFSTTEPGMLRRRRTSSESFRDFNGEDDHEMIDTPQIEDQSPAAEIIDFMRDAWKLPVPELIISVTGGAKLFNIASPRMRNAFQQGLISAVMATGETFMY